MTLFITTTRPLEFVDVTAAIEHVIQASGFEDGIVALQTRHTTTGLLVNEHEPLLLADLRQMFERAAPEDASYAHDDLLQRTVNLTPHERRNGHAHCRAALLRTSETMAVEAGALLLGRWQRIFFVEFDGPQARQLTVTLVGRYADARLRNGHDAREATPSWISA